MTWQVARREEREFKTRTPYVDWYQKVESELDAARGFIGAPRLRLISDAAAQRLFGITAEEMANEFLGPAYDKGRDVPIPQHAIIPPSIPPNPNPCAGEPPDWIPCDAHLRELIPRLPDKKAVIVGIIDDGIALSHARFRNPVSRRNPVGTTRFLANWQQGGQAQPSTYLPYGFETYQREIQESLERNDIGGVDEDAFNRDIKIADYKNVLGCRSVERHSAHGTHVLDLAAGFDPVDHPESVTSAFPLLAVTLPTRPTVGLAGTFLQFFMIQGLLRMVDLADAVWRISTGGAVGSFPIVVNISYGQQAGPKDGMGLFDRLIKALNAHRVKNDKLPVRIVMPVGNDNLERCRARRKLRMEQSLSLPWRVRPEDQSSNFVEIWSSPFASTIGDVDDCPMWLELGLPDGSSLQLGRGVPNHYWEITDATSGAIHAHVYCRKSKAWGDSGRFRYRFVVCVAPTLNQNVSEWPPAPAGLWTLKVINLSKAGEFYFHVQVDQSKQPYGTTSGRSYFDHYAYRTHLENGGIRDTFRYPYTGATSDNLEPNNQQGPVQRKGTHNSVATSEEIIVIGGYRESDGRPASYSSTTQGSRAATGGRQLMTAALPSETAPHYWGQLGASTRSGGSAALSGTSFATGHMTRLIAMALQERVGEGHHPGRVGSAEWVRDLARFEEDGTRFGGGYAGSLKVGSGRISVKRGSPVGRL